MSWAGCIPHPVEDRDVFAKLPPWRQARMLETAEICKKYPFAHSFRVINPSTGKPYPGQVLISEIQDAIATQRRSLPEVPDGYKFDIPNGVPRGVFAYAYAPAPTEIQAHGILLLLEEYVTMEQLKAKCTHDNRLLSDKPLDGVYAFIWRLARYMCGLDSSITATAFVDLIDGVSRLTSFRVDPWQVTTIMKFLEASATQLVEAVGGNKDAGKLRWAQAAGAAR
jgi:hypothetical protein